MPLSGTSAPLDQQSSKHARVSTAQDSMQRSNERYQSNTFSKTLMSMHMRTKSGGGFRSSMKASNRYTGPIIPEFNPMADTHEQSTITHEWQDFMLNKSSNNFENIQDFYKLELQQKEQEIQKLRLQLSQRDLSLKSTSKGWIRARPQTAKVGREVSYGYIKSPTSTTLNNPQTNQILQQIPSPIPEIIDEIQVIDPIVQNNATVPLIPQLTAKELADLFLECVTNVRKQDIMEAQKGLNHWTKLDKSDIIYKFITNKRVLQVLYDTMAAGKNQLINQSSMTKEQLSLNTTSKMNAKTDSSLNLKRRMSAMVRNPKSEKVHLNNSQATINNQGNVSIGGLFNRQEIHTLNNISDIQNALTDSRIVLQNQRSTGQVQTQQNLNNRSTDKKSWERLHIMNADDVIYQSSNHHRKLKSERAGSQSRGFKLRNKTTLVGAGNVRQGAMQYTISNGSEKPLLSNQSGILSMGNNGQTFGIQMIQTPQMASGVSLRRPSMERRAPPKPADNISIQSQPNNNEQRAFRKTELMMKTFKIKDGKLLVK